MAGDEIPAHESRSPTYGAKCCTQPGADVRITNDALETSLSAKPEQSWRDLEHSDGREGGQVSQSVHGKIGADGVANDNEDVLGVLWGKRHGDWVVLRRGSTLSCKV